MKSLISLKSVCVSLTLGTVLLAGCSRLETAIEERVNQSAELWREFPLVVFEVSCDKPQKAMRRCTVEYLSTVELPETTVFVPVQTDHPWAFKLRLYQQTMPFNRKLEADFRVSVTGELDPREVSSYKAASEIRDVSLEAVKKAKEKNIAVYERAITRYNNLSSYP